LAKKGLFLRPFAGLVSGSKLNLKPVLGLYFSNRFGFGPNFKTWVQILYKDIYSRIKINGFLTNPIPIQRGVRQGCPLSALLFILIGEVLGNQIREN
jgi:hypothetical protein